MSLHHSDKLPLHLSLFPQHGLETLDLHLFDQCSLIRYTLDGALSFTEHMTPLTVTYTEGTSQRFAVQRSLLT